MRLTKLDKGKTIWINVSHIEFVTEGAHGTTVAYPGDDNWHAVTESVDEVMKKSWERKRTP